MLIFYGVGLSPAGRAGRPPAAPLPCACGPLRPSGCPALCGRGGQAARGPRGSSSGRRSPGPRPAWSARSA
eukprot:scaffold660267_cov34-Prasinocladus_malaysianus.AAC.1